MEVFIFYLVTTIGVIVVVLKSLNDLQKEYDEKKKNFIKLVREFVLINALMN